MAKILHIADAIDEILGVTGSDFDFYDLPEEDFNTNSFAAFTISCLPP